MGWFIWIYREIYWCRRALVKKFCPVEEPEDEIPKIHSDSLPWFWIGMVYPDGDSVTVTDAINNNLQYGTRVTPEYLTRQTGFAHGLWKYMDSKTLEEKVFPSEGFVIEDVLDKQLSDSE